MVTHDAGFTRFDHSRYDIDTALTLSMAPSDPVKIARLVLTNRGDRVRRITLTSFVEWSLGVMREHTQHQISTRYDESLGTVFAVNSYEEQFASRVAFSSISTPVNSWTADRREFLGRNGGVDRPAGLHLSALAAVAGQMIDPCAAMQSVLTIEPGASREVVVLLGAAPGEDAARELIQRYRAPSAAQNATAQTVADWDKRLEVLTVSSPLPDLDVMVNRWALYQSLSCRMWGRSALYQSGGAYGFRDQLQDCMAYVHAEPAIARAHILRSAARQFDEGDVQHWWHPQSGRGVRTRFSDDLAWLPFVVEHYVRVTGDAAILDEMVPFISSTPLQPGENERYDLPAVSIHSATLYDHCLRALARACTAGERGLPLMGIGDWNDGMNRVGEGGRGESVWLAWFLVATLQRFSTFAVSRGDHATHDRFIAQRDAYVSAVESNAWDGQWFRRAYFDNGTPLGSHASAECRIDAIAQSWSVISGAGSMERTQLAMQSLEENLILEGPRLLLLLTPPFDKTPNDPGYIKGYLPGVRENGAQYTHAALWTVLATALQGDGDRAVELLQMINPVTRTRDVEQVDVYKVEPYVIAADIYSMQQHLGRGGWTWYTGSASWFYRVAMEAIFGFTRTGDALTINPCIPHAWDGFTIRYRFGEASYVIELRNPRHLMRGVTSVVLDGADVASKVIPLNRDAFEHHVTVTMG
jgi:cyclic beta-1,2-glucan synthetase